MKNEIQLRLAKRYLKEEGCKMTNLEEISGNYWQSGAVFSHPMEVGILWQDSIEDVQEKLQGILVQEMDLKENTVEIKSLFFH